MDLGKMLNNDRFSNEMNIEVIEASSGNASAKMTISEANQNMYGIVHGGALFTLADVASAAAAFSFNDAYVTMDSYLNFIQPGTGKVLIAEAKSLNKGPETVVVDVVIMNDQEVLIAKGVYTMYRVDISEGA